MKGFIEALGRWPAAILQSIVEKPVASFDEHGPTMHKMQAAIIFIHHLLAHQPEVAQWIEERGRTTSRSDGTRSKADWAALIQRFVPALVGMDFCVAEAEVRCTLTSAIDACAPTGPLQRVELEEVGDETVGPPEVVPAPWFGAKTGGRGRA